MNKKRFSSIVIAIIIAVLLIGIAGIARYNRLRHESATQKRDTSIAFERDGLVNEQIPEEQRIHILSPRALDQWEVGKTYGISWDNYTGTDPLTIMLRVSSINNKKDSFEIIAENLPAGVTSYKWTVPPRSKDYLYQIRIYPPAHPELVGLSFSAFSILDKLPRGKESEKTFYNNTYGYEITIPQDTYTFDLGRPNYWPETPDELVLNARLVNIYQITDAPNPKALPIVSIEALPDPASSSAKSYAETIISSWKLDRQTKKTLLNSMTDILFNNKIKAITFTYDFRYIFFQNDKSIFEIKINKDTSPEFINSFQLLPVITLLSPTGKEAFRSGGNIIFRWGIQSPPDDIANWHIIGSIGFNNPVTGDDYCGWRTGCGIFYLPLKDNPGFFAWDSTAFLAKIPLDRRSIGNATNLYMRSICLVKDRADEIYAMGWTQPGSVYCSY